MEAGARNADSDEETPFVDPEEEEFPTPTTFVRKRGLRPARLGFAATVIAVAAIVFAVAFAVGFLTCHFTRGDSHSHTNEGQAAAASCPPLPGPTAALQSCVPVTCAPPPSCPPVPSCTPPTAQPTSSPSPTATPCTTVPTPSPAPTRDWGSKVTDGGEKVALVDWLDGAFSNNSIHDNLMMLSESPHIAGGERNRELAFMLHRQWQDYGFDEVRLYNYTVLLSYPDTSHPNVLQLRDPTGRVVYNASINQEPPLTPGEDDPNVVPPFNAYSGVGNATGPLVYVNYGRVDDFFYLTRDLGLNLTGYICIARYGHIYRGNKANLAQRFGCAALIIYSDPADYAPSDGPPVYPDGPALPPGGVQRGSLMIPPGDPLTHGVPAIDGVYRRPYQEAMDDETVPSIPVQPISYGVAVNFLRVLSEMEAPAEWIGELNMTYYIVQNTSNKDSVYIEVNNIQEERVIYDVTATLYGQRQPDQMVILGNHRDAWVFGAVDPSSGTAVLMEIARGLGELVKKDWRPGRTLVLCSWDAEEQSLIGSTEWVEDLGKLLDAQTVAYLNVDIGVSGPLSPIIGATPLLYQAIYEAAKLVKSPDPEFKTVYDLWIRYHNTTHNGVTVPLIEDLASGTDYTAFLQKYGISCSTMQYEGDIYDVYHSVHETFNWISQFADPDFSRHLAMALIWSKLAMALATTPLLPFDPRDYAGALSRIYGNLEEVYGDELAAQNITLDYLWTAVQDFNRSTSDLYEEIQAIRQASPSPDDNLLRIANNKLMNLERSFIHAGGLPGRPLYKHVVFAPSSVNSYGSSVFPGVSDTIFNARNYGGSWDEVRKQIDIVRVHILHSIQVMEFPSLKYISK